MVRSGYLVAAVAFTAGATLCLAMFFARFSRFHVVEDYLPTGSGIGRELVQVFPQEDHLMVVGVALMVLGAGRAALEAMQASLRRREGQ